MLTADQAEQAIFGSHGLAETLAPGSVVVCMSTMAPARTVALGERANAMGLGWLDAPVSGGSVRAGEGTLTTMVGGDAAALETARPVIEGFSQFVFHLGPVGAGSTVTLEAATGTSPTTRSTEPGAPAATTTTTAGAASPD